MTDLIHVGLTEKEVAAFTMHKHLMLHDIGIEAKQHITADMYRMFDLYVSPQYPMNFTVHDEPLHPSFSETVFLEFPRHAAAQPLMFLLNNSTDEARRIYRGYSIYLNILETLHIGQKLYHDLSQWGAYRQICTRCVVTPRLPHKKTLTDVIRPHVLNIGLLTTERLEVIAHAILCVRQSMAFPLVRDRLILSENLSVIW